MAAGMAAPASGETSNKRIALSNSYDGNSWRRAMLKSWEKAARQAVRDGTVAEATAFTTRENQAAEQAAQVRKLIRQGYDAIVIDAASPSALNGAIKQACDAGIVVVSFDGAVTEPCAWRISIDFRAMGKSEMDYLKQAMPAGGNLLEIRGVGGVSIDDDIHAGIDDGVKENPQFKVVASVQGDWTEDTARHAVAGILPSLPQIEAVVTQGGDGYGVARAFQAAGRPMPIIILGNRAAELQWWKLRKDAGGYKTMSISVAPGISTLAFRVAQMILDGQPVPKQITAPFLRIDQDTLEANLANTEEGGVANREYSLDDAKRAIAGIR